MPIEQARGHGDGGIDGHVETGRGIITSSDLANLRMIESVVMIVI